MVLFLTLEVGTVSNACFALCFPIFGAIWTGPFQNKQIIESHVGTSVVLFLTFENVGVIFITYFFSIMFVVCFLVSLLYSPMLC